MSDIKNLVINNESYNIVDDEAVHFTSQNLTTEQKIQARNNILGSYSTEEQDTGMKWIDNKPIYRRTFTGTVETASSFITIGTIENLENVVSVSGGILTTTNLFVPVNTHFGDTYRFFCFISATAAGTIDCVAASYFGTATITVEYTKTNE